MQKLTFLGTGTSTGVPCIGCECPVCLSNDSRNNRLRSSIWLEIDDLSLLVDAGPDLRQQAIRAQMRRLDAVIYTHGHLDHVTGFDELRAFCWHRDSPLPLYANPGCMNLLQTMFAWAFSPKNTHGGYVKPAPHIIDSPFTIGTLHVTPLPVAHGEVETCGYRFEAPGMRSIAYIPDAKSIPASTLALLENLDIMILDGLREKPHPTHLSIAESIAIIQDLAPRRAYLTHISHETDHLTLSQCLPENIHVAHDNLTLNLHI